MTRFMVLYYAKRYLEERIKDGEDLLNSPYINPSDIEPMKKIVAEMKEDLKDIEDNGITD